MRRKLGYLLLFIGIVLFTLPFIGRFILSIKDSSKYVDEINADQIRENSRRVATFNFEDVRPIDLSTELFDLSKIDKDLIIGQIISPAINLNLAIFKGTNDTNLKAGACTLREDQEMGKNNYPIAGHNLGDKDKLFNRVEHIPNGTDVFITDKDKIYQYKIVNREILPEDAFYKISAEEADKYKKPIITLMTCEYPLTYARVFAVGELQNTYDFSDAKLKELIKNAK